MIEVLRGFVGAVALATVVAMAPASTARGLKLATPAYPATRHDNVVDLAFGEQNQDVLTVIVGFRLPQGGSNGRNVPCVGG